MFKLYKRPGSNRYYVRFTIRGKTIRETTATADKELAEDYAAARYQELYRQFRMGERPAWKWQDGVIQYLTERNGKRNTSNNRSMLQILSPYFADGRMPLAEISGRYVAQVLTQISQRKNKQKQPMSVATRNRYAQLIRAILRAAATRWEDDKGRTWLEKAPYVEVLEENNARDRWLTREEACRLVHQLPPHLGYMVLFALYTGLRESNITGLRWSWVDLDRRVIVIPREEAKAGKPIPVYLVEEAYQAIRDQIEVDEHGNEKHHDTHVFTFREKPITRINNSAWKKARDRAGLQGIRVHDLRRTWASWHLQTGTRLDDLMRLGGWASPELVRDRYAHLAPEQMRELAEGIRMPLRAVE